MSNSEQAKRFRVSGRVQGVGYRFFVQDAAGKLGIAGYVKNLADGCVEVYAIGASEKLQALEERLRQGPRLATVERVAVSQAEFLVAFSSDFSIETGW